jgi:hypothetical protein
MIHRGMPLQHILSNHMQSTSMGGAAKALFCRNIMEALSYGPPWAHYLGGYQDRLLGGPLGLPDLRCTAPDGVKHKDYRGEVLG